MSKVTLPPPVSNSLGDFSVYQQRGVPGLIIRAKGGPSKEMMKNAPQFHRLRLWQSEFRGGGKAASLIMNACKGIKRLSDYPFIGQLTKISLIIQNMDEVSPPGQRSILFSEHGKLLNGLNLNREHAFDTVVTSAPSYSFSRNQKKVSVSIPDLYPGINLLNPWNQPVFRFIISLGVIPDMVCKILKYVPANQQIKYNSVQFQSIWFPSTAVFTGFTTEVALENTQVVDDTCTMVLGMGIEFGKQLTNALVNPVKHAGCAKILSVG